MRMAGPDMSGALGVVWKGLVDQIRAKGNRMGKDDVVVERLMKDERNGVEKWHVVRGDLSTYDALSVQFLGKDAQRLAYEYAAGVLAKKDEHKPDPFLSAYAKAVASAPPSPWISVKERMPEGSGTEVMVYRPSHTGSCVFTAFKVASTPEMWMNGGHAIFGVTHWMPLPEPPKE